MRPPRLPRLRFTPSAVEGLLPFTLSLDRPHSVLSARFRLGRKGFALSYAKWAHDLHTSTPSITMSLMTTRDFKVFLEPDDDYGGYVVVCPSIPTTAAMSSFVLLFRAAIRRARRSPKPSRTSARPSSFASKTWKVAVRKSLIQIMC